MWRSETDAGDYDDLAMEIAAGEEDESDLGSESERERVRVIVRWKFQNNTLRETDPQTGPAI